MMGRTEGSHLLEVQHETLAPDISPNMDPLPLLPLLAPYPLVPFMNNVPKLSGIYHTCLACKGSAEKLHNIYSISQSNLSEASCPVSHADEIDNLVDSSRLLASCGNSDAVNEFCIYVLLDSGCLLPSLPSDATYDKTYGISIYDLNDNFKAPSPDSSYY
ncbi:hypothetical protein RHSIM_Rhsim04G0055000 [Rhododendron simsii]|uniref:Uncharacterized protein n=1 Tax=Rhododendron simsii TaxID=118357 RepID=A0A834H0R5_RHOSS|nr:hypothetical protein RHSIM_Rhsim04G0055100 [Rhododendron simsii]KAF7146644.1 hypothetical protein RHSIM_Rhsim04G0055000 [Rhododendron simsii]